MSDEYIINPDTGKCVKASGRVGKKVMAKVSSPKSCKPRGKKGKKGKKRPVAKKSAKMSAKKKACKDPRKSPTGKGGRCVLRASQKKPRKAKASPKKASPKAKACKDPRKSPTGKNGRCVLRASQKKPRKKASPKPKKDVWIKEPFYEMCVPLDGNEGYIVKNLDKLQKYIKDNIYINLKEDNWYEGPEYCDNPSKEDKKEYEKMKKRYMSLEKMPFGVKNITSSTMFTKNETTRALNGYDMEFYYNIGYTLPLGVKIVKSLYSANFTGYGGNGYDIYQCTFKGKKYYCKTVYDYEVNSGSRSQVLAHQRFAAAGLASKIVYAERVNATRVFVMMEESGIRLSEYLAKRRSEKVLDGILSKIERIVVKMCKNNLVHAKFFFENMMINKKGDITLEDFQFSMTNAKCHPEMEFAALLNSSEKIENEKNSSYLYLVLKNYMINNGSEIGKYKIPERLYGSLVSDYRYYHKEGVLSAVENPDKTFKYEREDNMAEFFEGK